MQYFKIEFKTSLIRVLPDEIVYFMASGNYTEMYLNDGTKLVFTMQLGQVEDTCQKLQNNNFVRLGRSLIVNTRYVFYINLTDEELHFSGQQMRAKLPKLRVSRDSLLKLKQYLDQNDNTL